MRFVLGSSSPARLATLQRAGVRPEVLDPEVDEDAVTAASVSQLTATLAELKGTNVLGRLDELPSPPSLVPAAPTVIVACDTMLEFEGQPVGKPGTPERAIVRWYRMRGHQGVLHTGHHVIRVDPDGTVRASTRVGTTVVTFADLTDAEIAAYAASGEPERVAGAFTIDGLGGAFITRIDGDPANVIGISLPLVRQMLLDLGLSWHTLWDQ